MPLRPTLRCYRALTPPTTASGDAVWVTDDILIRAFQRYVDISHTQRRDVSSVPGPLYHRKRFGRRQMTELNAFQSAASLPPWAISNAPDRMEWKWQPPKPELWSPFPSLSLPDPPAPTTTTTTTTTSLELVISPEAAPSQSNSLEMASVGDSRPVHIWQQLHDELHAIRTHHRGSTEAHTDKFAEFLQRFSQTISDGQISGAAAADVYVTAFDDLQFVGRHEPEPAKALQLRLMSSLVEGVRCATRASHNFMVPTPKFWDKFVLQVVEFEPTVQTADLLALGMQNLRTRHGRKHYEIMMKSLARFFDLWQGAELHGEPEVWNWPEITQTSRLAAMWSGRLQALFPMIETMIAHGLIQEARFHLHIAKRCLARAQRFVLKTACLMSNDSVIAEKLASGLAAKDLKVYRVLYTQATRLLGPPQTNWSRAHYNWLEVLARLPNLRTSQFQRTMDLFARRGSASLSHTELCKLLLLHWESRGRIKLRQEDSDAWKRRQSRRPCNVLAELALLVNKNTGHKECTGIFWSYWGVLRDRGGPKPLLRQLVALSKHEKLSRGFMKRLAWTSNRPQLALLIHQILAQHIGREHKNLWWPAFWDKFASRINLQKTLRQGASALLEKLLGPDPSLGPLSLAASISMASDDQDIHAMPTPEKRQQPWKKSGRHRQVERLNMGLTVLKQNRQITKREAINVATKFTVMLANAKQSLSARDLATLTYLVMRTLDEGRCGSRQRFKWYLNIIDRFLGEEACRQVDLILKRRRDMNWALWRRRVALAAAEGIELRDFEVNPDQDGNLAWQTAYMNRNGLKRTNLRELERPVRVRRGRLRQWCRMEAVINEVARTANGDTSFVPLGPPPLDLPFQNNSEMATKASEMPKTSFDQDRDSASPVDLSPSSSQDDNYTHIQSERSS